MVRKLAVILDDGHGMETAGKRSSISGMKENEFNRAVVADMVTICKSNGFLYKEVAPTDSDTPLSQRTNTANVWVNQLKKQYPKDEIVPIYLSVHANAGGGTGCEAWVYNKADTSTVILSSNILAELAKLGLKNRGVKRGYPCSHNNRPSCGCNFAVNRNTTMPSSLIECAFMDTKSDAEKLLDSKFRCNCAIAIMTGVCKSNGFAYDGVAKTFDVAKDPLKELVAQAKAKDILQGEQFWYEVVAGKRQADGKSVADLIKNAVNVVK